VRWQSSLGLGLVLAFPPGVALAQPADLAIPAATTSQFPEGISVAQTASGPVYVDAKGRTLYGMDMRTVHRWSPDAALYCQSRCAEWEPMLAPAGRSPNIFYPHRSSGRRPDNAELKRKGYYTDPRNAPDWTIIAGPQGPQWVYKGWHMVYVRKGDVPGSTAYDGLDDFTWNTLKYIPPVPAVVAPANVGPILVDGAYVLALDQERLLFTGDCGGDCANWLPLPAGMANRGLGQWTVSRDSDEPQWKYRGVPVFVAQPERPREIPGSAQLLTP
jgi:predicted lipoprotein with Yx(FWY)xxD motif